VNTGRRIAVVTGASAGIGAATARRLAGEGFTIVAGARRRDRLEELGREVDAVLLELDVRRRDSIEAFAAEIESRFGHADVLINNAGLALGKSPVDITEDEDWVGMLETNVLGLLRVTRALLPLLRKAPHAHIVNLGSIAGFEVYKGGAGYTATKHAVRAISRTLRLELNGEPIRITEVAPGMVETEFSVVRFKGDRQTAANEYRGVQPLVAEDIADIIAFCVTRPPHVDIDEVVVRPIAQAAAFQVTRKES
jgi:NADP-dependent 3-hydroxy acid dehydrogenase YdfG